MSFNRYYYATDGADLPEFQLYYLYPDNRDSDSMPSGFSLVKLNGELVFANIEIVDGGNYIIDDDLEWEYHNKMRKLFIDL